VFLEGSAIVGRVSIVAPTFVDEKSS